MSLQEKIAEQFIDKAISQLHPQEIIEKLVAAAEARLKALKEDKNHNGVVDGAEVATKLAAGAQNFKEAFEILALK